MIALCMVVILASKVCRIEAFARIIYPGPEGATASFDKYVECKHQNTKCMNHRLQLDGTCPEVHINRSHVYTPGRLDDWDYDKVWMYAPNVEDCFSLTGSKRKQADLENSRRHCRYLTIGIYCKYWE